MQDLAEFLDKLRFRGFDHHFFVEGEALCHGSTIIQPEQVRLVSIEEIDCGTDPGDDVSVYLFETDAGMNGFLVVSSGSHADPEKAAFVDKLSSTQHEKPRPHNIS
jgi:hypothetical protein